MLPNLVQISQSLGPAGKVGFSKAMSAGWITLDKTAKPPLVKRKVASIEDNVQVLISTKVPNEVTKCYCLVINLM